MLKKNENKTLQKRNTKHSKQTNFTNSYFGLACPNYTSIELITFFIKEFKASFSEKPSAIK